MHNSVHVLAAINMCQTNKATTPSRAPRAQAFIQKYQHKFEILFKKRKNPNFLTFFYIAAFNFLLTEAYSNGSHASPLGVSSSFVTGPHRHERQTQQETQVVLAPCTK